MEMTVRISKYSHDKVVDENAVRAPMSSTSQCKAFGRLIDGTN